MLTTTNQEQSPYINNEYQCASCGNIGESHPVTSYCFICGEDNWEPVSNEQREKFIGENI